MSHDLAAAMQTCLAETIHDALDSCIAAVRERAPDQVVGFDLGWTTQRAADGGVVVQLTATVRADA